MAKTTKYLDDGENHKVISEAVETLSTGQLVVIPTETVYGLAADATNPDAVNLIYSVKGRPSNNPLICHVCGAAMARRYVKVPDAARKLMDRFWPGPLTLVLPIRENSGISRKVTAGLSTLAVRSPDNPAAQEIIAAFDRPVAAPSANPSGKLSPVTAEDVETSLGDRVPLIVDYGQTRVGIESTIVAVTEDTVQILRPGSITEDDITEATGLRVSAHNSEEITAPGQLKSHYAPDASVVMNITSPLSSMIHVGFGPEYGGPYNLSPSGNLEEAAHNLFPTLRLADKIANGRSIAVAPIPDLGIGIALNDRLVRASSPRGDKK